MKKIALIATCAAAISAYALPTYEPFTEYTSQVMANPTNAIDLCTGGFTLPSGERWTSMNYNGFATTTNGNQPQGIDVLITNNSSSVFTAGTLSSILPSTFPGYPASVITIMVVNPSQTVVANTNPTVVGNSAVLNFASDITRPASGTKTLFVSYLVYFAQMGQLGSGNDGRYLDFVASSNLVEPSTTYKFWSSLFNTFNATTGPKYCGHGLLEDAANSTFFIGACDSSAGKDFSTTPFVFNYNAPLFVVGEYTFTATGSGLKDTNSVWVNPVTTSFGGPTPPAGSHNDVLAISMTDIGGMTLEDRVGSGASGGVGTNYIANLMVGSTWSYVTGGPEFTNQPVGVITNYGSSWSMSGSATAAGQTVSYQWVRVGPGNATTNITDTVGGAGGSATVTGSATTNLQLSGLSAGDFGSYELVATASSTLYSLGSTVVGVTADPLISSQPQTVSTVAGGTAVFNVTASTQFGSLSYQWLLNGSPIFSGSRGDGSVVTITTNGATCSLTIANVQSDEFGDTFTCAVTNGVPDGEVSLGATLNLTDPLVTTQPQSQTVNYGATVTLTSAAQTAHGPMGYAWFRNGNQLANGTQADNSTVTGAVGSAGSGATVTLTLTGMTYQEAGSYTVVFTNSMNSTGTSSPATLVVNDPIIITQPPATVEVGVGSNTTITVSGVGSGVTYQWFGPGVGGPDISGGNTPTLTITGAQSTDAGNYYVVLTGPGPNSPLQSSNANVIVENPVTAAAVSPPALTQQVGTHLAVIGTVTGGSPLVHYQWTFDGNPLANGAQSDGSTMFAAVSITTNGIGALDISNIQVLDAGTYALIASNANGSVTSVSSCVVAVSSGLLPLSTSNLVVTRVGEGSQTLSGATGNTLYLDQITTNGRYVSTIMVPDTGSNALIVPGGAAGSGSNDSPNEAFMTLSANGEYLNFAGYFQNYPFTAANDVTVGGGADPRTVASVDGLGSYTVYTNYGLYSGGNHYIRDAFSTDGLTNFWVTGAAGSGAIKFVQNGSGGASYATGNGVPALGGVGIVNGPICLGLAGTNLVFSDNAYASLPPYYPSDTNLLPGLGGSAPAYAYGLNIFSGEPEPTATDAAITTQTNLLSVAAPADFAISPDQMTIYIADSDVTQGANNFYNGGIQRYDFYNGGYNYTYNLYDLTGVAQTNGLRGLTVVWTPGSTGVTQNSTPNFGAILYATSSEMVSNRLIQIIDNGGVVNGNANPPTETVLATAGPNQFFRGVRFGPATVGASVTVSPPTASIPYGNSETLIANVSGDAPFTYQWQFDGTNISEATGASLVFTNLQLNQSGTYTVTVSDPIATNSASSVLTIFPQSPVLVLGPQSLVETVGDHTAFSIAIYGSLPISYQWATNGVDIPGATTPSLVLTNIALTNAGIYTVTYANQFGTNTATATLQVTTSHQALSSSNLVVVRLGDGAQLLSSTTGNTVYLDQITTAGVYSNTIMCPDNSPNADLIIPGGQTNAAYNAVLTLSANSSYLNLCGFDATYPASTFNVPTTFRALASVDGYGIFTVQQVNQTLYDAAGDITFNSIVSSDGTAEFWTTGLAGAPPGVKYCTTATSGAAGGVPAIAGSAAGTRVINIIGTNVVYTDSGSTPKGLFAFVGEPTAAATSNSIIADVAGNPNDFAVSPDTTSFPPTTSTVYLCDNSPIASGGGIQRYDWNGSAYALSYALALGVGTNGASCLTVDFSAHSTWGTGVTGAIIYATTAGASSNTLVKIVDNGAASTAAVLVQANQNEILRGVRFGPVIQPLAIVTNPASQSAELGEDVAFTVVATGTEIGYQWYTNGGAIPGATASDLNLVSVQLTNAATYTVIITNPVGASVLSLPATLTVNAFSTNSNLVGWWRFNDGSGLTAADSSVYNDPGTLMNFPNNNSEWVSGLGGKDALDFANVDTNLDNTVVVPDEPQLNFTNGLAFTLSAWIQPTTNQYPATDAALISKGYGNGGEQFNLDIYTGYLRFFVRNSAAAVTPINATTVLPATNAWLYVAATFDGNGGTMSLYTNGQLVGTAPAPSSLLFTASPLTIGNRQTSNAPPYNLPFVGDMQDVRIYNVALGQQDIQALYQSLAPVTAPSQFTTNTPGVFVAPGHFQLTLSGTPGAAFRLWTTPTTNAFTSPLASPTGTATVTSVINTWTLVSSGTFGATGTNVVTDLNATNKSQVYMMTQP